MFSICISIYWKEQLYNDSSYARAVLLFYQLETNARDVSAYNPVLCYEEREDKIRVHFPIILHKLTVTLGFNDKRKIKYPRY